MNRTADLPAQDLSRLAIFPFSLMLADTNNRNEIVIESSNQLLVDGIVSLAKELAALRSDPGSHD